MASNAPGKCLYLLLCTVYYDSFTARRGCIHIVTPPPAGFPPSPPIGFIASSQTEQYSNIYALDTSARLTLQTLFS